VTATLTPPARARRDLNALLKISTALSSIRGLAALERPLLELIFEVIPAERGAVLLTGKDPEVFESLLSWDRLTGLGRPMPIQVSRTIAEKVRRQAVAIRRRIAGIAPVAEALMIHYDWPGNVRELENVIERAVVLGSTDLIVPEDLPEAVLESEQPGGVALAGYHNAVKRVKRDLIVKAVEQADGNYVEAARLLGLNPNYLHRLIRRMDLKATLKKFT
jgi:hypothetical protein